MSGVVSASAMTPEAPRSDCSTEFDLSHRRHCPAFLNISCRSPLPTVCGSHPPFSGGGTFSCASRRSLLQGKPGLLLLLLFPAVVGSVAVLFHSLKSRERCAIGSREALPVGWVDAEACCG